jgi:biopolymer transport protein TolR
MAMNLPGRSAAGEAEFGYAPLAEINVTPMVDVMLVLLIIFMVAAPLMTVGVPVDLPKTAAAKLGRPQTPLVVSIDRDGRVFAGKDELPPDEVVPRLAALKTPGQEAPVYVRADRAIPYGRVMEVMGQVGQAGFARVSLIAEAPGAAKR